MKYRNTTILDVEKEYIKEMDKVKQNMFMIPNRIFLIFMFMFELQLLMRVIFS